MTPLAVRAHATQRELLTEPLIQRSKVIQVEQRNDLVGHHHRIVMTMVINQTVVKEALELNLAMRRYAVAVVATLGEASTDIGGGGEFGGGGITQMLNALGSVAAS
ncbi:hypothetical protein NL676_015037 [Syzygium grande]|nr:hypothetical protein NL676_015037 [Syzygium grande]